MSIDKVRGTDTLTLRLTKEDKAALDELVEVERVELAARGVAVSLAQYVRGLIRTAHAAMVAKRQAAPAATPPATVPAAAPAPTPPARTTPAPSPKSAAPAAKTAERTAEEVRQKLAETIEAGAFNQATIGKQTGIDAAMLSRFRKGTGNLGAEKLATLARWLWKISEN